MNNCQILNSKQIKKKVEHNFSISSPLIHLSFQIRRQQINQRSLQAAAGSDQLGDRQPEGSAAVAPVNPAAPLAAAADGTRLCLRAKG